MQNYEALVEKIASLAGVDKAEIQRKIEAKKASLSGLISNEGAAQIVASDLGVHFEEQDMKIKELMPGMRKVNVVGKVINLFPVREFEKKGRKGKVANFIIADETSNVKVVLWDTNQISLIENNTIGKEDVVEIKNANMRDGEIHLGGYAELKKSDKKIDNVKTERVVEEKNIDDLELGRSVKVRGVVVQMFQPRFFNTCSECGKKVQQDSEGYKCEEHGNVTPRERAILNFVIDDGTENVRVVLFSDQINQLIDEADLKDNEKAIVFREDMLGSEVYVSGNVRKNKLFNNTEIIGRQVEKVDVEELVNKMEGKEGDEKKENVNEGNSGQTEKIAWGGSSEETNHGNSETLGSKESSGGNLGGGAGNRDDGLVSSESNSGSKDNLISNEDEKVNVEKV